MMNFLKDWIIQYKNKYSVGGVETTIERVTGTVAQEGDTVQVSYLNEIQKHGIYEVTGTRVIEGVNEIYDISIDGSEEFTPFNQTFLIDFSATNTKTDSLLRFNGKTYSLRFSDSISNGDIAPKIGFLPKRALIKLDVKNSKAIIVDFNPNNFISPAFTGTPTAPTATVATNNTQIATTAYVKNQGYAPLASPALSGVPTAPTATAGATGKQLANVDFVNGMLGGNTVPAKYLASEGWVKLANGLIIQWGYVNNSATETLPTPFSNTDYIVVPSIRSYSGVASGGADAQCILGKTTTSFKIGNFSSQFQGWVHNWIAIGY